MAMKKVLGAVTMLSFLFSVQTFAGEIWGDYGVTGASTEYSSAVTKRSYLQADWFNASNADHNEILAGSDVTEFHLVPEGNSQVRIQDGITGETELLALMGLGLAGLGFARRNMKNN